MITPRQSTPASPVLEVTTSEMEDDSRDVALDTISDNSEFTLDSDRGSDLIKGRGSDD